MQRLCRRIVRPNPKPDAESASPTNTDQHALKIALKPCGQCEMVCSYAIDCNLAIVLAVKQKGVEYRHERRVPERRQKRFGELKVGRELLQQLPRTVQKQQKQRTLLGCVVVDNMAKSITAAK